MVRNNKHLCGVVILFFIGNANAKCNITSFRALTEKGEYYRIKPDVDYYPAFLNIHTLARADYWKKVFKRLGIEAEEDGTTLVPVVEKLNPKLEALGSPFKFEEVDGVIEFAPWLDLMGRGKYPLGEKHDLETHAIAMMLIPPEIGYALQGQIRILRAIETELDPPEPVKKLIRKRLNSMGNGFEGYTYAIGEYFVEKGPPYNMKELGRSYQMLFGRWYDGDLGAAGEVDSLISGFKKKRSGIFGLRDKSRWREWGFQSTAERDRFVKQVWEIRQRLKEEDADRYDTSVGLNDFEPISRRHFERIFGNN